MNWAFGPYFDTMKRDEGHYEEIYKFGLIAMKR